MASKALTDVPGFRVGHWTNLRAITGCTVVLCPPDTSGGCDVRGNSPGSRELMLLGSEKSMQEVHAVLFAGGSAYGLAAADGVMRYLEEHDIGYATPWGKVPIVPSAVIFDLNIGDAKIRPDASAGYSASGEARSPNVEQGNVGAGTGAVAGKWAGPEYRIKGGLGTTSLKVENIGVGALAVVNAVGDVVDADGKILAGARLPSGEFLATKDSQSRLRRSRPALATNTTLVVSTTNVRLSKVDCNRVAQRMHDGLARAIAPVHTLHDGDTTICLASGRVDASVDVVAEMAVEAAAEAIRNAVRSASSLGGVPG